MERKTPNLVQILKEEVQKNQSKELKLMKFISMEKWMDSTTDKAIVIHLVSLFYTDGFP